VTEEELQEVITEINNQPQKTPRTGNTSRNLPITTHNHTTTVLHFYLEQGYG